MTLSRMSLASVCLVGVLIGGCGAEDNIEKIEATEPLHTLDLADVHLRHGKLEIARKAYQDAGALSDESDVQFRVAHGLGLVAEAEEKFEEAVKHLRKALDFANEKSRNAMRLKVANFLRRAGRTAEAEKEIDTVLAGETNQQIRGAAYRELVSLYKGREEKLAEKIEAILREDPKDRNSLAFLGDLYAEVLEQSKKALEVHERHLELEPNNTVLVNRLLSLSLKLEETARGIKYAELLQSHLSKEPRLRMGALRVLADLHRKTKGYEKALAAVERCSVLAADDEKEELRRLSYEIRNEAGTLDSEIARLEEENNLEDLWLIYAGVKGDFVRALEVAKRIAEKNPKNLQALRMVVVAAARAEKDEETAEAGRRLLEMEPKTAPEIAGVYAAVMKKLNREKEGVKTLSAISEKAEEARPACYLAIASLQPDLKPVWHVKAVEASRGDATLCYHTAVALRKAGSPDDALNAVKSGMELNPARGIRIALAWEQVQSLGSLGRFTEAETICRSLTEDPDAGADMRRLAERTLLEILQKQGKPIKIGKD